MPDNVTGLLAAASQCYGSSGGGASVAFHHQLAAYNIQTLMGSLEQLRRALAGGRRRCCGTACWQVPPQDLTRRSVRSGQPSPSRLTRGKGWPGRRHRRRGRW